MSKLSKIKAELAKLLLKHSVISTDKAVIEYDGEKLTEGVEVYSTDENGEKVAVADGEYKTEDNKVITVKDGKVESIVEVEETVEAEEEEKKDDTNEQKEVVDEQPTDSVDEETEEENPEIDIQIDLDADYFQWKEGKEIENRAKVSKEKGERFQNMLKGFTKR